MIYKLTEKEKENRHQLNMMRCLILTNPDRFKISAEIDSQFITFTLKDEKTQQFSYVMIANKPNSFNWKWKDKYRN
jgi:hypothetical protein